MNHIKKYINSIGLGFPETEEELKMFEEVNKENECEIPEDKVNPHDILRRIKRKQQKTDKSDNFFKRAVLAAEITSKCYHHKTFGRVKFQKLHYLCEQASQMELETNYLKQTAGPFDNRFMHTINQEFNKQQWFKVEKNKRDGYEKVDYTPLAKRHNYKEYYNRYFNQDDSKIQYLISLFMQSRTREVELVATIFFCWEEILSSGDNFSQQEIIKKVYDWAEEKKKFSEEEIIGKISWMIEKGVIPNEV